MGLEPDLLERVAAECGGLAFEADVRDADALQRAVDGTVEGLGGIDVAVANAGIAAGGTFAHAAMDAIEQVVQVNLLGAIRTLKLCLPHVSERRGYMLQVASMAAIGHPPGLGAYAASKAGVEAIADVIRIEVRHRGVDVGVAYFGWIDTELVRAADEHRDFVELRGSLRGPLGKTYPATKAADAIVRGVERRAGVVAFPRAIRATMAIRGALPVLLERGVRDRMPEFDRLSGEERQRLGERATNPVGAGGEAAVHSRAAQR